MTDEDDRCRCRECKRKLGTTSEQSFGTCDKCCTQFVAQFAYDKSRDEESRRFLKELRNDQSSPLAP